MHVEPTPLPEVAGLPLDTGEIWRPIPRHPGYEASTLGRIRSIDRLIEREGSHGHYLLKGRILKVYRRDSGHLQTGVGGGKFRLAHQLVLEAHIGPAPAGAVACHGNGDPSDNRLVNLRWDTRSSNALDAVKHGVGISARTHCPQRHPLVAPNLAAWAVRKGTRACLACARGRTRQLERRRRGVEVPDIQTISDICYAEIMRVHSDTDQGTAHPG